MWYILCNVLENKRCYQSDGIIEVLTRLWPRLDKVIFKPSKKMKLELLDEARRALPGRDVSFLSHCCIVSCCVSFSVWFLKRDGCEEQKEMRWNTFDIMFIAMCVDSHRSHPCFLPMMVYVNQSRCSGGKIWHARLRLLSWYRLTQQKHVHSNEAVDDICLYSMRVPTCWFLKWYHTWTHAVLAWTFRASRFTRLWASWL